jgi:protein-S-isoprenylcysteine O-methyltransferase Ste14
MKRVASFIYGVTAHLSFLAIYAWLAGFVGNLLVSHSIDAPSSQTVRLAVVIDLGLIALFGLQHSIMARPTFKQHWTKIVPQAIERSTYVFASCAVILLLIWRWRALNPVIWDVQNPVGRALLYGLFATGWVMVPAVSLLINHFDLFGTRQVWLYLRGRVYTSLPFRTPSVYTRVRHPLYVGWVTAFWATPTMTAGHLLFAAAMTAYIFIAIFFEERNLIAHFGRRYEEYRRQVPMFLPWRSPAIAKTSRRVLYIKPNDWTWWAWTITTALLIAGLLGYSLGFVGAMVLTAGQGLILLVRDRSLSSSAVQMRGAYLALLMICYLPSMRWLYWLPTVGTFALIVFGYCLLARVLSLLPWNSDEAYTLDRLRRTFFSAPDLGRVKSDPADLTCAGGLCTIEAQIAPKAVQIRKECPFGATATQGVSRDFHFPGYEILKRL